VRNRRLAAWAAALGCTVVLAGLALGAASAGPAAPRLTLDGVVFKPELALTSAQRSRGLMQRKQAPRDGMLFVFRDPTRTGFWMKNTLVPLTIVFFTADGKRVRKLRMVPCRSEACPIYDPMRVYRFALELPAGDRRPALRIGPAGALRRLIRQSS
jgi:uncharacterized membrane protein (UPF0127 family)